MTTETKGLPKSLYTVTAIVRVAELYMTLPNTLHRRDAVARALVTLGYAGAPDPHGLAAKALKVMEA